MHINFTVVPVLVSGILFGGIALVTMANSQQFNLRWNNHMNNILQVLNVYTEF
jgi:hypothetical protein